MTTIRSAWKFTLDPDGTPVVILDFGDRIASEPEFNTRRGHELIEILQSDAPFLRDLRNLSGTVRIHRIAGPGETDAAARTAILDAAAAVLSKGKTTLRIDVQGNTTHHWLATQAMLIAATGTIKIHIATRRDNTVDIVFAGLSKIANPPPPPPP
jgi:hypothetical protein